jgi:hypothetical protein
MNDLEGAYRLVMRILPDGTIQMPPSVQGWVNIQNGLEQTTLRWSTSDGKPASGLVPSSGQVMGAEHKQSHAKLPYPHYTTHCDANDYFVFTTRGAKH